MKPYLSSLIVISLLLPNFVWAEEPADAKVVNAEPAVPAGATPIANPAAPASKEKVVNPSLVGWGNFFVPGLGATLAGKPLVGLQEAATEIGLYYGGTFGVKEGNFGIDGAVRVPHTSKLKKPVMGQIMQELGLKYHFYNTFHHYQQAVLASDQKSRIDLQQPIYQGTMGDMLLAPFQARNLKSAWVWPLVTVSSAYLIYSYKKYGVTKYKNLSVSPLDESLFGVSQGIVIPFGGLIGEEPLFRGFIMREARKYTDSLWLSLLIESAVFTALHPQDLRLSAFASGIYFGLMADHYKGNLEQAIAAHFWVNAVSGIVSYWLLRREQGKNTPFQPPIVLQANLPF